VEEEEDAPPSAENAIDDFLFNDVAALLFPRPPPRAASAERTKEEGAKAAEDVMCLFLFLSLSVPSCLLCACARVCHWRLRCVCTQKQQLFFPSDF